MSDHEFNALNELQRQLESDHPSFVRKFTESGVPIEPKQNWLLDLAVGVFTLLGAFAILVGLTASAIGFATFFGFLALLRHGQEPGKDPGAR